jgi:hypothetical protein
MENYQRIEKLGEGIVDIDPATRLPAVSYELSIYLILTTR